LCCPYEKRRDIRVEPQKDGTVKCPQCGSVYDVFDGNGTVGIGYVKSGPSEDNLQVYIARNIKEDVFVIRRIN
jgi:nitrite reductase/ring-hydroxylating ferredoxin subunit